MNDKLIQIGGKSYKQCEVIVLPFKPRDYHYVTKGHIVKFDNKLDIVEKGANMNSKHPMVYGAAIPQHLYILSSEEIKEGDWYMYCHFGEWIISNSKETINNKTNTLENLNKDNYFKKIIATTDFELRTPDSGMKAGYYMKDSMPLPRPSDDFIKVFVKTQGKIDKVLVEYEKSNYEDWIKTAEAQPEYKLKIAPDNTITIKPVQEKTSWSREEVVALIQKLEKDGADYFGQAFLKQWIEENL